MKNKINFLNEKVKCEIKKVSLDCRKKRRNFLDKNSIELAKYKDKLVKIRKKTFSNFEENLKIAKDNFKKRGFLVREATNIEEAKNILEKSIKNYKEIIKSKTNTGREIGLEDFFKKKRINFSETDLGDFIVSLFNEEDMHYVLPSLHITPEMISNKIKEKWNDNIEPDAKKLTHYLCAKIRKNILRADLGVTGANFFTRSGQIILLENEGNISLVSRIPEKHIVICGIDKLVENEKDSLDLCRASALFGTGQEITQYISIISGPSKTADIQNKIVKGAQGAKEVEIILLDNGRREALNEGFEDILRCINCGSCINFCPVYQNLGAKYGGKYLGSKGVIMEFLANNKKGKEKLRLAKKQGSFKCTFCGACKENCPMQIDLPSMIKKIRNIQKENGLQTQENREMIKKIKKYNNPFGEIDEKNTPDKLYCC